MTYQIFYTKSAFQDVQKLDVVVKKRIKKKIEEFSLLINSSIGSYRWRIGNYRIVFDIDKNKIIILRVVHRREIYK